MNKEAVAKSVNDRLKAAAKARGGDMNQSFLFIQRRFAYERFLARIGGTSVGDGWLLKGGVLMLALRSEANRTTQDIDFTIRVGDGGLEEVVAALREIAAASPEQEDGLTYELVESGDQAPRTINETMSCPTARVHLRAVLNSERPVTVCFKVDATRAELPRKPILRALEPTLRGFDPVMAPSYSWEAVAAEKLHACVTGTIRNPRLRDYMDLVMLARSGQVDLDGAAEELRRVFAARGAPEEIEVLGLSDRFAKDRQADYAGTRRTTGYGDAVPECFVRTMAEVRTFAAELLARLPGGPAPPA
jgi:hypothetical protein